MNAAAAAVRPLAIGEPGEDRQPILYLDGVSVSFDGFKALDELSFYVEPGELRAIIGPNGAGKTTMMDVITGKTRPDTGKVFFKGSVDLTKLDEAAAQLSKSGAIRAVLADPATAEGAEALIAAVPETDILVNNLGIYEAKPFTEISDADWHHIFEVNVVSGARLSRHYFPKMLDNNWGRVIFIASESGLLPPAEMVHYGTTKTAQLAIARGLAEQTRGTGVTVNTVMPGPTRSDTNLNIARKCAGCR